VFLTTHLTAVIVLTSYSAYLVSFVTTRVFELPFDSFEEFLKAGTHQLAVEPFSSQIMYFKVEFALLVGAFAKSRIATVSFVMSVRLSVCPHGTTRLPLDGF
jgi:hypothetical protein